MKGPIQKMALRNVQLTADSKTYLFILLCSRREQKYSSILQPSLKVISKSLIPKDFFSNLK